MKVLIAGATGLVGSALTRKFRQSNWQVDMVSSKNLDLLDRQKTFAYVKNSRPDLIIDAAAKVGGISSNNLFPAEYLSNNLQIQCNLMDAALKSEIERFIFLGSSCIYPRDCTQPILESALMTGPLEKTNSAYAVAKIAGIEGVKAVRKEFGLNWISLMPTNVYGFFDNFNLIHGHVVPALIRKFTEAVENKSESVYLYGDGSALREFINSEDLAEAVFLAMEKYDSDLHLNIGTGHEVSIAQLASMIARVTNFKGSIEWDSENLNGTPRKILDSSRIRSLGWSPRISLEEGIAQTVRWFQSARIKGFARL